MTKKLNAIIEMINTLYNYTNNTCTDEEIEITTSILGQLHELENIEKKNIASKLGLNHDGSFSGDELNLIYKCLLESRGGPYIGSEDNVILHKLIKRLKLML